MLLFVGLGNPTPDSENNRHNVGFKIIDSINKKFGLSTKTQVQRASYNWKCWKSKNLCYQTFNFYE